MTEVKSTVNLDQPRGHLTTRTVAATKDTNTYGDIFGGWLMAQMDIAAYVEARKHTNHRMATVAVDKLEFHAPVMVGDIVSCYTELVKMGRTSMTIYVDVWVERLIGGHFVKVTHGHFIYVALDENRRPVPIAEDEDTTAKRRF